MRREENHHFTEVRSSLGLIGWEILGIGIVSGYKFYQFTSLHWLYGVLAGFVVAGILFALIINRIIRTIVFVSVAVATGVFTMLLLKIWVDSFVGIAFGLLVGCAVFYWHSIAYDVFQFSHSVRQRTKEREQFQQVRDEFERL